MLTSFTFFGLLSSSLSPCLSQHFGRCTLWPSSDGWNVKLNPLFCLPSVERYHCKLNFQSTSSKLSKANISLVFRVGANDNVKLILVFTFKAASVSSVKLLSVLRTSHTSRSNNNNRIQRSSYRLAPSSKRRTFVKSETTSFASKP